MTEGERESRATRTDYTGRLMSVPFSILKIEQDEKARSVFRLEGVDTRRRRANDISLRDMIYGLRRMICRAAHGMI